VALFLHFCCCCLFFLSLKYFYLHTWLLQKALTTLSVSVSVSYASSFWVSLKKWSTIHGVPWIMLAAQCCNLHTHPWC
jgi:hypothetical protein